MEDTLKSIYYDPKHVGAYASVRKLFDAARKIIPNIKIKQVEEWMRSQFTHTLHRGTTSKFNRRRVIAQRCNQHMQCDLMDMQAYRKDNDGYNFVLAVIDVFSKFAFAVPLKDKSAHTLKDAFETIFNYNPVENVFSDRGTEFINSTVQKYFKDNHINFMQAQNKETKASVCERFIRTLKSKLFKYMTARGDGKYRYIDVMPQFVQSYNETRHSATKMRPIDVNDTNEKQVFRNLYRTNTYASVMTPRGTAKFAIDDSVRIKYDFSAFDKKYFPNWTDQVYTVTSVIKGDPFLYKIKNYRGEILAKRFYGKELQKITIGEFRINKVLKRDPKNKRAFVSWIGYPNPDANSWIAIEAISRLQ